VATTLNLDAYLARIEYRGRVAPDLTTLRTLHLAHVSHIPFENLDIQMGLPILLNPDALQAKIIERRRGGYCFEQNTLFLHALLTIGFDVTACEARVRLGATCVRPRTHMVVLTLIGDRRWLCDVGFGGDGLLEPVALDGELHEQAGLRFRIVEEHQTRVLRAESVDGCQDLYEFVPEGRYPVDFEMANWFTSTHPESPFVKTLTVQSASPEARRILRNLSYTVARGHVTETCEVLRKDLVLLLRAEFGLEVPTTARFRALDDAQP
jgi:N-hydroxyarylamine O-acetyltransferase